MSAPIDDLDIKDSNLVYSNKTLDDGNIEIIIENYNREDKPVFLGYVLNFLPSGIVCKDETGMGATSLELMSARPSIIVEPLKITAATKAHKHGAIYFGSDMTNASKPSSRELRDKLESLPVEKRKIMVVADSLKKVKEILDEEFEQYFLLIDEADSFQLDSSFRSRLSICLDIYKKHPEKLRALVTATPLKFSDPQLQNGRMTIIKYVEPKIRNIQLVHTRNVNGVAIEVINKVHKEFPDDKIMIAYNSVSGCVDMANHLVDLESWERESIKILCSASENSRNKAGVFFHELEDVALPGKINFFTSAYFTGFDLQESYHLISITDGQNPIFLLSEKRLKQIAGRCRKELMSETVVYSTSTFESFTPQVSEMIRAAKLEIKALECIDFNFRRHPLLQTHISDIRKNIVDLTGDKGAKFVRFDIIGNPDVNYLSIDASLEMYRVGRELYSKKDQLARALEKEGHNTYFMFVDANVEVIKSATDKQDKATIVNEIINEILESSVYRLKEQLRSVSLSYFERELFETYIEFESYLDKGDLIEILKSISSRDNRKFRNLKVAASFTILSNENNFKIQVFRHFKIDSSYTHAEIIEKWKLISTEIGLGINSKSFTKTSASTLLNLYFKTTKRRDIPTQKPSEIKILDHNPKKFNVLKYKGDPAEKPRFHNFF